MDNVTYEFVRKHKDLLHSIVFNLARLFGYLRLPTCSSTFRYALSTARAGLWQAKIGKMGKGVRIDSGVIIRGQARNIEIGDYSYIDVDVHFEIGESIKIGRYVHIAPSVYIQSGGGEVIIGEYAAVANNTWIYTASNTYKAPDERERNILLSMSAAAPEGLQFVEKAPVAIEEYAFVGIGCVVLPGVRIGRGAVVGAGSVVTKDIPPYTIAVGVPAMVVSERLIPETERNSTQ